MIHTKATKKKIRFAKKLRKNETRAETAFNAVVKAVQDALGVRFWRQTVLLGWIVDFWCPKLKLAVEIDGPSHDHRVAYDARRARIMERELGATTLRFSNRDVLCSPLLVEAQLHSVIKRLMLG
jgi:very-short-patch-repair endonuclease